MNHATDLYPAELRDSYRMGFTVGEHSAGHMRRILRMFLGRWALGHLADAAELALTELVANVVRHVPGRRCTVLILREPHGLRVEVADTVSGPPLHAKAAVPLAEGGRGLTLVEAVTDRWGVETTADGKTVWFECDSQHPQGLGPGRDLTPAPVQDPNPLMPLACDAGPMPHPSRST
ncbi:ATP-binding protein [Streptomyces sp. NPDC046332]|uniref:ATP-binding protein n=1 Tax=Streptomyces sp. NPDC046332 TaxID=3155133 RepID=UPI0033D324AC